MGLITAKGILENVVLFFMIVVTISAQKYQSAPGCPTSEGIWLKDEDGTCQKVYTRANCGQNMIFFPHPKRSDKGFCDCFDARAETEEEIEFLNNRELSGCLEDVRNQIFVPERNRCYSAFDQGPCRAGQWLVLNGTHYPVCAKNHCPPKKANNGNSLSVRYQFSHSSTDKCYQTMTRGYCPKSYHLRFSPNDWLPKCRYGGPAKKVCPPKPQVLKVFRSRCKPGSRRDYLSNCSSSLNPRR